MPGFSRTISSKKIIPVGKIPPRLLKQLLDLPRKTSSDLLVGPSPGEDAAVLRMTGAPLVVTSDPITFKTPRPGYYAIHINANDIAVMGGVPRYFTLTLMMPPSTTERQAAEVMNEAIEAADSLDVVLIGGHTEVTESVRDIVVSVTMLGDLVRSEPLRTSHGQPGDAIIQVGQMGVEGTSILAHEYRWQLGKEFGRAFVDRAAAFLVNPGLSVVAPALLAAERLEIHAMHDPTEGGLATGLNEVAIASETGLIVKENKLLIAPETVRLCDVLQKNPLGLISSGCLIFTLPAKEAKTAVELMTTSGFLSSEIGSLTGEQGKYYLEDMNGHRRNLPAFDVDELASR